MKYLTKLIPTIPAPVRFDAAIQALQLYLHSKIPWLEMAYGAAEDNFRREPDSNRVIKEPNVYAGDGEYIAVLPNNLHDAMCFFYPDSEARTSFNQVGTLPNWEQDVSVIFWLDMQRVSAEFGLTDSHNVSVEPYIADVIKVLRNVPWFSVNRTTSQKDKVWKGWDIDLVQTQTGVFPEANFRISGRLSYPEDCNGLLKKYLPLKA